MEFVRVKRRYDEDPFNSIVVSHKKLKTIGADLSKDCVFQFAATIKDENEISQILKEVKEGKSVKYLTKTNKNKNTNNVIEHSKAKRLKLVDKLRAVKQDTVPIKENDGEKSEIKVVDFVKQAEDNGNDEGISVDYVYDLYYASSNDDKSIDIQDIDSVHGFDSDKFYNICRSIDESDSSSHCEDEDDSNDENNWRNDYPDEDEDEIDSESENLIVQSNRWTINSNSSSDIEDGENDICDYEANFAKYKQRVKAEEHYFYNSVVDDSLSGSNDSDN